MSKRKSICINLTEDQLNRFDFCKEVIEQQFDGDFLVSRTDTINYLCRYFIKKENLFDYYKEVFPDPIPDPESQNSLDQIQIRFPF